MRQKPSPSASLEREVIVSVVILYLLITAAMLAIHYFAHGRARSDAPAATAPAARNSTR